MLNIQQIILREILLPLKEPFQISSGTESERHIFLIKLKDVSGVEGWGECVAGHAPNYSPETIASAYLELYQSLVSSHG